MPGGATKAMRQVREIGQKNAGAMTKRPQTDMSNVLRAWRMRRDIAEIAGIDETPAYLRRGGTLTQALMAALLGVGERHYRCLERGERGVSEDLVARCAEILALDEAESATLYAWAGHRPPPPLTKHQNSGVPSDLMHLMHASGNGSYWSDDTYTVLAYNRRAAWHWPWMQRQDANIMTELLAANSQGRAQCLEWETEWAPRLVAQLRRAAVTEPDHQRLQHIVHRVRRNRVVERLWDSDERATVVVHAYGTVRPMRLPLLGDTRVSIQALVPMARPDLRLITGILVDATEPTLPLGPPPPPEDAEPRP